MADFFSKKTFEYFDSAVKNRKNKAWFDRNKPLYEDAVREPFAKLVQKLRAEFASELPKIEFNPKKISQPCFRANRIPEDGTIIKPQALTFFSEKATSMFELNPGIYFSVGQKKQDNVMGVGLYMVSGRQMSLLRAALADSSEDIAEILENKKLKKTWKGLAGEKYKKFPRGYNSDESYAPYMWHKQFYLGLDLTRKDIASKTFIDRAASDLELTIPFLKWVIQTVGTYRK